VVERLNVDDLKDNVVSLVEGISVDRLEGNEEILVVERLSADGSEDNEDSLVLERLNVNGLEDDEVSLVELLSVDCSE